MANASDRATIDPAEAARFDAMAAEWWSPTGSSAPLHRLNPVRLAWLRERVGAHFGVDPRDRRGLAGLRTLDVGCGAGLLTEPLARLGADVSGIDAAPDAIAAARAHAAGQGLSIDYQAGEVAALPRAAFDLVTAFEVLEHVADRPAFLEALRDRLAPGGLLLLSTPPRSWQARLIVVEAAERLGPIPRGTHDWSRFVTEEELDDLLTAAGFVVADRKGIALSPTRGFVLSDDRSLDFLIAAVTA